MVDSNLIEFLMNPGSYPERPASVTYHETHISCVFVGDVIVYKVKKPVNMGFLDYTTLEKRRYFCTQEVTLNARLAPGVYLGVAPIYRKGREYSLRKMAGGVIAEYAVRMKRIPEKKVLASLVGEGKLLLGLLGEVGAILARFHQEASIWRSGFYGGVEAIRANAEENFEQIKPHIGQTIDASSFARLASYTTDFVAANEGVLRARKDDGFVREGHGDLHSQHVCLTSPPIIFDCIEFNTRFRIGDVLEDVAFLLMDVEYRGRFDLSSAVSNAYSVAYPQALSPDLLRFYKVYRAVVRGKIEGFTADVVQDRAVKESAILRARNYYMLAEHYLRGPDTPFNPVVFMGVSGSGKSAVAQGLCPDGRLLRSDEVRKELAGVPSRVHEYSDYGKGIYGSDMTARTYEAMLDQTLNEGRAGKRVIVDATFLTSSQRRWFYEACVKGGVNPFFVYCFADDETLRQRVRARRVDGVDISDADATVLERQLQIVEEPLELPFFRVMRLNTGEDKPEAIRQALRLFL